MQKVHRSWRRELQATLVASLFLAGCATQPPPAIPDVAVSSADALAKIDLRWAGSYKVESLGRKETPGAVGGAVTRTGARRDIVNTTRVSREIGSAFGIGFAFPALRKNEFAAVQVRWIFPQPGLLEPASAKPVLWQMHNLECWDDGCSAGWVIQEPWEQVPGTWTVEVLAEGRTLLSRSFELY